MDASLHSYINEGILTAALSLGGYVLLFPIRTLVNKVKLEWESKAKLLTDIQEELKDQRINHLTHIQASNDAQVKLLEQAVNTLGAIHLDQRTLLGRLDK